MQSIYLVGGGLIIEANIPVQELEVKEGRGLIFGRIRYMFFSYCMSLTCFVVIFEKVMIQKVDTPLILQACLGQCACKC